MKTVPLVGLVGKKRAGKDTFAAAMGEAYGFERVAFADALKDVALTLDPIVAVGPTYQTITGEHDARVVRLLQVVAEDGWEQAKEYPEVRRVLQHYGAGIRELDPEFWIRAAMGSVFAHLDNGRPVVVTDVRYENEAEFIRDAGGVLVRILRPGVEDGDSHPSETELDAIECDALVRNVGDVESLRNDAAETARHLHNLI